MVHVQSCSEMYYLSKCAIALKSLQTEYQEHQSWDLMHDTAVCKM